MQSKAALSLTVQVPLLQGVEEQGSSSAAPGAPSPATASTSHRGPLQPASHSQRNPLAYTANRR